MTMATLVLTIEAPAELVIVAAFAGLGSFLGNAVGEWSQSRFANPPDPAAVSRRWSVGWGLVGVCFVVVTRW